MLTETMTYDEKGNEIKKDYQNMYSWLCKERKRILNNYKKKQMPGDKTDVMEWKSPLGNTWTIWIRTNIFKPDRNYFTAFTIMQSKYGLHYFTAKKMHQSIYVLEIQPHTLKRIKERCKKKVPQDTEKLVHNLFLRDEMVIGARANRKDFNDVDFLRGMKIHDVVVACFRLGCIILSMQTAYYMLARTFMSHKMMFESRNREVFSLISNLYVEKNQNLFDQGKIKSSRFYIKNRDTFYKMEHFPALVIFPFAHRVIDKPKWMSYEDYFLVDAAYFLRHEYDISLKDAISIVKIIKNTGSDWNEPIEKLMEKNGYSFIKRTDGTPMFMSKVVNNSDDDNEW